MSRISAQNAPSPKTGRTFLEYDKLTADLYTFFVCTRLTISEKFYDLVHASFAQSTFPDFDVSLHLGYIGMSSLNIVGVLKSSGSTEELAHNVNQVSKLSGWTVVGDFLKVIEDDHK